MRREAKAGVDVALQQAPDLRERSAVRAIDRSIDDTHAQARVDAEGAQDDVGGGALGAASIGVDAALTQEDAHVVHHQLLRHDAGRVVARHADALREAVERVAPLQLELEPSRRRRRSAQVGQQCGGASAQDRLDVGVLDDARAQPRKGGANVGAIGGAFGVDLEQRRRRRRHVDVAVVLLGGATAEDVVYVVGARRRAAQRRRADRW